MQIYVNSIRKNMSWEMNLKTGETKEILKEGWIVKTNSGLEFDVKHISKKLLLKDINKHIDKMNSTGIGEKPLPYVESVFIDPDVMYDYKELLKKYGK